MKKISKLITLVLMALLVFMPLSNVQAAQEIKISKSSLTINVGQIRRLTISNVTTVKWKTSNKSVATVSSKGNVKAITEGTATITGTANKKSYSCTVTVLPKILSEDEKVQNITYKTYTTDKNLVVCLKNNNAVTTSEILALDISIDFFDASGNLIYKSPLTNSYYHVASGKEFVSVFDLPKESIAPYNYMAYSNYKVNIKKMSTINYKLDVADKIGVTENIVDYYNYYTVNFFNGKDTYDLLVDESMYNYFLAANCRVTKEQRKKLNLTIDNNSGELIDNISISILYYKDNQVIAVDNYRGQLNVGKSTLQNGNDYMKESNKYGYRTTFESSDKYDSYKIIVNYAYVPY